MTNRLLTGFVAATVAATLAVASPVLARGPGGFGGGGGAHFGGGGGMHVGGMGGGHFGGASFGGARFAGSPMGARAAFGPRFAGSPMAARAAFVGPRFAGAPLATRAAFGPRFAGTAWHGRPFVGRHAFFFRHHRFHRFAFVGAPFVYANYYDDGCWRRTWTPYGWQWVNVCGDYWY
ncbi:hypothetical protein [Bradyrhizobium liaoningense]|uniref:hypothetical protein n=1 Tax=Bradyrhizobium liaoningense TaxID=43992 RepID=UPI001BA4C29C|nr:hypothetical protein [Bradyrhizobium liaoningense]MBR0714505.1 hypothetical protein [Bradyrhizobium liaoningense]